jgi:hypothetical protein
VTSHARDSISIRQVSPVERLFAIVEVREQDVAANVESDCVVSNEASAFHVVDFDPSDGREIYQLEYSVEISGLTQLKPNTSQADPSSMK